MDDRTGDLFNEMVSRYNELIFAAIEKEKRDRSHEADLLLSEAAGMATVLQALSQRYRKTEQAHEWQQHAISLRLQARRLGERLS